MTKPWFNADNWQPWVFKGATVPYVLPAEVANAFGEVPVAPIVGMGNAGPASYSGARSILPGLGVPKAQAGLDGSALDLTPPTPPPAIPGLVGELVNFCWNAAKWQIAEVAIASALSAMSLLASRVYRHGTLGLSLYLLVLAKTSTGKSFGYTANDMWLNELAKQFEGVKPPHSEEAKRRLAACKQLIMGEIGSAQGLAQQMPVSPATLFHADEYVEHIKMMAQPNPPSHMAAIRAELLRLMEMSGPGRIYRGRKYSKRSNAQEEVDVLMASLTILATGTPEAFYDDISSTLLTSGFLPRFTILEYSGNLTTPNSNQQTKPSKEMMNKISLLFNQQYEKGQSLTGELSEIVDVQCKDAAADARLQFFENACLRRVIEANEKDLPTSGLWSRAKDHVKQIAALIAIGVNPYNPLIEAEHVDFAIGIVLPNVEKLSAKVDAGEVGLSDDRRISEIRKFMAKLYIGGFAKYGNHPGIIESLLNSGVIQIYVVRNYCKKLAAFRNHPLGSTRAFNDAFQDMVKYREVELVDGHGVCVKLNMSVFGPILEKVASDL